MIDNIKIIIDNVDIDEKNFIKRFKHFHRSTYKRQEKYYFSGFITPDLEGLEEDLFNDNFAKDDKPRLKIKLKKDIELDNFTLSIQGSIRKWFYGVRSSQDFTKKKFSKCINDLANLIGIKENEIWRGKITKIETGITLRLKDKHRGMIHDIFKYKNARKNTFSDIGVEFKSANYDVIFYDLVERIFNKGSKGKGKNKKSTKKKINKNNFLFRYEIQSHKVSGTKMFQDKLNTVYNIERNWDYIGKNLLDTIEEVVFLKNVSIEDYTILKEGTLKTIKEYLIIMGIKKITPTITSNLISKMSNRKKGEFKKNIFQIYEKYEQKTKTDNKIIFVQELKRRIAKLS